MTSSIPAATFTYLVEKMQDSLPQPPTADHATLTKMSEATVGFLVTLHPRDALEVCLAARIVTTHDHVMGVFR